MASRSSALPYTAVAVLAVLFGVSNGVRQYLPVIVGLGDTTPVELSGYLLGATVVNALFVPVGAAVVGYVFADGLDVERRLGITVAATFLLATVCYLAGFGVVLQSVPDTGNSPVPLGGQLLSAAVVGVTNGLALTTAVVAGAAVRRLRGRPVADGDAA